MHVLAILRCFADDASSSTAPFLPETAAFLIATCDTFLPQAPASQHAASCACQALTVACRLLARRCHSGAKSTAKALQSIPTQAVSRLVALLDMAAMTDLPMVPASEMHGLLDEFFEMQRLVRSTSPSHPSCSTQRVNLTNGVCTGTEPRQEVALQQPHAHHLTSSEAAPHPREVRCRLGGTSKQTRQLCAELYREASSES